MIVDAKIYDENTDTYVESQLTIHYTPSRKGNGFGSFYGPTPDEEAEVILETVEVNGMVLDEDDPLFLIADDYDFLLSLVE